LLTPDQKAFYDVDVRGNGQSDLLQITGKARIGAHDGFTGGPTGVRVTALDPQVSYQNGQAYTILTAQAGVSGRFDDVTTRSAFLTPSLSYTDTSVVLTLAVAASGGPTPTPTPPDPGNNPGTPAPTPSPNPTAPSPAPPLVFDRVARTANQYATAMALNSLVQSGDALALYNGLLELSEDEALVAFDQLSGQLHASTRGVLLEDRLLRDGIRQRMHNADPDSRDLGISAWLSGGGASARNDAGSEAHRLHSSRNGLVVGVDGRMGDAFVLGLALGQQEQRVQQRSLSAATDIDSVHGGLYAGLEHDAWSLLLGGSHTTYSVGSRRQLGVGVAPQSLHSDYDARGTTCLPRPGGSWRWAARNSFRMSVLPTAAWRLTPSSNGEATPLWRWRQEGIPTGPPRLACAWAGTSVPDRTRQPRSALAWPGRTRRVTCARSPRSALSPAAMASTWRRTAGTQPGHRRTGRGGQYLGQQSPVDGECRAGPVER
jgi:outer membrane autotransporter barrel domain